MILSVIRSLGKSWGIGRKQGTIRTRLGVQELERRENPDGNSPFNMANFDIIGRTSGGEWWTGSKFDTGTISNAKLTSWNPAAQFRDVMVGNFDGDSLDDIVGRDPSGRWWVTLTNPKMGTLAQTNTDSFALWNEAAGWRDVKVADVNGDGKDDLIGRTAGGEWWAGISNGTQFSTRKMAGWNEAAGWRDVQVLDVNGDGKDDIVARTSIGEWWAGTSNGQTFATSLFARWNEAAGWRDVRSADVNGDSRADVIARTVGGEWWAGISTESSFTTTRLTGWNEAAGWRDIRVADVNGDGQDDVVARTSGGEWWVGKSTGTAMTTSRLTGWNEVAGWRNVNIVDANRDGKQDILAQTTGGEWWLATSSNTTSTTTYIGTWNPAANWTDIHIGQFQASGVSANWYGDLEILGNRNGTNVTVSASTLGGFEQVNVSYRATNGTQQSYSTMGALVGRVNFIGHDKADVVFNNTARPITAYGRGGNDELHGGTSTNDHLYGEAGDDKLYAGTSGASFADYLDGGEGNDQTDDGLGLANDTFDPTRWAVTGRNEAGSTDPLRAYWDDIQQGYAGNCWFWASVAAAVDGGVDFNTRIRRPNPTSQPHTYEVQLYRDSTNAQGVKTYTAFWQQVDFDWSAGGGATVYGDPRLDRKEGDYWQALVWRAYRIAFNLNDVEVEGAKNNVDGGWSGIALPRLTGVANTATDKANTSSSTAFFDLKDAVDNGYAVSASTYGQMTRMHPDIPVKPLDSAGRYVPGHAYTIITITGTSTNNAEVYLYNPWGDDGSSAWYDKQFSGGENESYSLDKQEQQNYDTYCKQGYDDGYTWVSWSNFMKYFDDYTINPI